MAYFHLSKAVVIQVDSSKYATGAVLLREGCPVWYASGVLTACEKNGTQIEKEVLSVLFGLEKFDNILMTDL